MRNSLFVFALVFSGTVASCFNPDLTGVTVTCDPPSGGCPDGQECSSQGVCVTPGTGTGTDMAIPSTLIPAEGCPQVNGNPGVGFDVTAAGKPTVYACPAKFQNKAGQTADAQCRAPYVLCTNANNIDLAACTKAGQFMNGYFIAEVIAQKKFQGGATSCGPPGGGSYALWAGCGRASTQVSCQGFTSALECTFNTCTGTRIGDITNNDGASGVLCCKQ